MKLVGVKIPAKKFKIGQKIRCIEYPNDLKGVVMPGYQFHDVVMMWCVTVRITHADSINAWGFRIGDVCSLFEVKWELQP